MKRRTLVHALMLGVILWLVHASIWSKANADGPSGGSDPTKTPNIIFILTDDLSDNLIPYMPNVLNMQREGMSFSKYFVTDSLCCPSRSSIFTGKFPHNTGVFTNNPPDGGYEGFLKAGNEPFTFAVALQGAGYKTAMLGKYLNGYYPKQDGARAGNRNAGKNPSVAYGDAPVLMCCI